MVTLKVLPKKEAYYTLLANNMIMGPLIDRLSHRVTAFHEACFVKHFPKRFSPQVHLGPWLRIYSLHIPSLTNHITIFLGLIITWSQYTMSVSLCFKGKKKKKKNTIEVKTTARHWNQNYPTIRLQHKHLPATSQKAENNIILKIKLYPYTYSAINVAWSGVEKRFASGRSQAALGARQDCRTAWLTSRSSGSWTHARHNPGYKQM